MELVLGEGLVQQFTHRTADTIEDLLLQFGVREIERRFAFGFAGLGLHLQLRVNEGLNGFVAELKRLHHDVFGDLICAALDHQDRVACPGDSQVQVRGLDFGERGIDDELSVHAPDANGTDRSAPGDV